MKTFDRQFGLQLNEILLEWNKLVGINYKMYLQSLKTQIYDMIATKRSWHIWDVQLSLVNYSPNSMFFILYEPNNFLEVANHRRQFQLLVISVPFHFRLSHSSHCHYTPRKERALKIYTDDTVSQSASSISTSNHLSSTQNIITSSSPSLNSHPELDWLRILPHLVNDCRLPVWSSNLW